ncbi:MAG TPA: ABC transporter permease [Vicinamibacterales bacterium]|jgi:predicted permease
MNDLRHAWRSLVRTPGFTAAALVTVALGIGATTAIFSLVNTVLLEPVPYPDPDRIAVLTSNFGPFQSGLVFTLVRDRVRAVETVAAQSTGTSWNLSTADSAVSVKGLRVSTNYLMVHGVRPRLGREFTPVEDQPGGPDVVMVSAKLWDRLFADRTDALGARVQLSGKSYTVVGVLPSTFASIPAADVLTPLRTTERDTGTNYRVIGRLRSGITAEAADAELESVRTDLIRTIPGLIERRVPHFTWSAYREVLGRGMRQPLLVLLGAVGFLLLIACVNVANLYIARAVARHREMATRAALGAGRAQLIRTVLSEALLLATAGAVLGLAVAWLSSRALVSIVSEDYATDVLAGGAVGIDWRVLLVMTVITVGAGLFFGLAPALVLSRLDPSAALGSRSTAGPRTAWLRRVLTVAEMALAVALLVGSGLLIRTFMNMTSVGLGFTPSGIVIGRMSLQGTSAENADSRERLVEQALARMRQLPGVTSAAFSNSVPVESGLNLPLLPPEGALIEQGRSVDWRYVTPDYFSLFEIATRIGRTFDDRDSAAGRLVAVVNEAFARTYFGRLDVIGRTIALSPLAGDAPREIVGVVADVKARSNSGFTRGLNALASDTAPAIFVPAAQAPDRGVSISNQFFDTKWIVRTNGLVPGIERAMREAVRAVDPTLAFVRFESMTSVIGRDLDLQRLLTVLLGAFAASALLLASVGLYGLIAYSADQRRQEVGIRMALGATTISVLNTFVCEGIVTAGLGLGIGIAGAVGLTRVLTSRLFGVTALDLTTFAAAGLVLVAVAAFAALIPASSAARTSPVQALRGE